jgi:maltose alpha-D-glucosyltransferase/alpha-amylase
MQWADAPQGGFTTAGEAVRPMIAEGDHGYPKVNVREQEGDPESLFSWFERAIRTLRECPEINSGAVKPLDPRSEQVLALQHAGPTGTLLVLVNLGESACTLDLTGQAEAAEGFPVDVLADRAYPAVAPDLGAIELDGRGYRWLRLARSVGA